MSAFSSPPTTTRLHFLQILLVLHSGNGRRRSFSRSQPLTTTLGLFPVPDPFVKNTEWVTYRGKMDTNLSKKVLLVTFRSDHGSRMDTMERPACMMVVNEMYHDMLRVNPVFVPTVILMISLLSSLGFTGTFQPSTPRSRTHRYSCKGPSQPGSGLSALLWNER